MTPKKVKDVMVPHTIFIQSASTLQEAAEAMKDADCAVLPVGSPDRFEGLITDHDLVIRAIINGEHAGKPVGDYMKQQTEFCNEDDTLEEAYEIMQESKLSRLIVKNADGRVTGLISMLEVLENSDVHHKKLGFASP